MSKVLFLWLSKNDFYPKKILELGYDVSIDQVFVDSSLFSKIIRRVVIYLDIVNLLSFWINSWKKDINNYQTIILHASKLIPPVIKYIRRKNSDVRIIVWYWNPIAKTVKPKKIKNLNCEIWSFDYLDSKRYNIKYNTQYFFEKIKLPQSEIKYDILFIGSDKGRLNHLLSLEKEFNKIGLKTYFHIVNDRRFFNTKMHPYKQRISYDQVLKFISESKVILDFVSNKQYGLTVRVLEALMLRKKLITNHKDLERYDFYNKNNIFILGVDNLESLPNFVNGSFQSLPSDIIKKYDFDSWLKRFF